jgi:formate hydrogenlyase transcriptional activator
MISLLLVIAVLTAGISLTTGTASLANGLTKQGEKADLLFGFICIFLFIYLIIPPVGFIQTDKPPYAENIILKRFFKCLSICFLPWFVLEYAGYKKVLLPLVICSLYLSVFFIMVNTPKSSQPPLWEVLALVPTGMIAWHGFSAVRFQYKSGEKSRSKWLLTGMVIYTLLYFVTLINRFGGNFIGETLHLEIFSPVDLFPLAFVPMMGVRLRANLNERIRLQFLLNLWEKRLGAVLTNIQFVIIQLDKEGIIKYINPFAINLFGYLRDAELLEKNWFDCFSPPLEVSFHKYRFKQMMATGKIIDHLRSEIICRSGEKKIINWSNTLSFDDQGMVNGSISLGSDITEQEKSLLQIHELEDQLEKEKPEWIGELLPDWAQKGIIGNSEAIAYVIQKAKQVASTNVTVLLEGETGVGKELFAELIQKTGLRGNMPFIKVNCGALPAELMEDELFGHEKGAFTGAIQSRKGRFELANGGTLFLDELGELPIYMQPKLLRVLQNGEFERVGGQQTLKVDVRVIAATNRDLAKEVKEGRFRDDLYYRLNVFPISIPPLRNRKDDIPMMIRYFIDKESKKHGKEFENISRSDIEHLLAYPWPGNVRELGNVIERAVISSPDHKLKIETLSGGTDKNGTSISPQSSLEQVEKEHILKVLENANWRINGERGAAEILAMHPNTLRNRMKKLDIYRKTREY